MLFNLITSANAYMFATDNKFTMNPTNKYNAGSPLYGSHGGLGYRNNHSSHLPYEDYNLGVGHLREDDLLQRRFTSHGLANYWLVD